MEAIWARKNFKTFLRYHMHRGLASKACPEKGTGASTCPIEAYSRNVENSRVYKFLKN
jgi:hypothetical protein